MRRIYLLLAIFCLQTASGQETNENATVHIVHLGSVASYIELPVFYNSDYIGSIQGNKTITYEAAPGDLSITGVYPDVNMASTVNIDVKPGGTYYILGDLKGGAFKMEPTKDHQLIHYFMADVTGNDSQIKDLKKQLRKKRSFKVSDKKKMDYEATYGDLVKTTIELTANHIPGEIENSAGAADYSAPVASIEEEESSIDFPENKRELAYQEIIKAKNDPASVEKRNSGSEESSVIRTESSAGKISRSEDNDNADLKYRRSSLYTMMINDTEREHFGVIRDAFGNFELSEKFNDHNLGPYLIDAEGGEKDQSEIITAYLNENGVARDLVAKWFNRNPQGEFNMDLVAERGSYNASDLDVLVAGDSKRGSALLADAGEELIGNTFIIVNDYKYVNKEEVAKKASGILNAVSTVASAAGYSDVALIADATNLGTSAMGKGYVVKTSSYLYRLVWNEEIANEFYTNLWVDNRNFEETKKDAFEKSDLFKLKLVGSQTAWADLQSTVFTKKSDEDLIRIATIKATDKGISKLQRKFEEFRTKSPLLSGDPIAAKIGLKEGLERGDKFEVLEQVIDKNGRTKYTRVGKIKVDPRTIWDNSYLSEENEEEEEVSTAPFTEFKGSKNNYYSGMLIRQIN